MRAAAIMLLVFLAGVTLWLIYGLFIGALPVILANGATLSLVVVLLATKPGYLR